jgi:hypothetical protein
MLHLFYILITIFTGTMLEAGGMQADVPAR